jgi:hypothetical protein
VLIQLHSIKEKLQEIMKEDVAKMNSERVKVSYMVSYYSVTGVTAENHGKCQLLYSQTFG